MMNYHLFVKNFMVTILILPCLFHCDDDEKVYSTTPDIKLSEKNPDHDDFKNFGIVRPPVIVEPKSGHHTASIIFLHGLGDQGIAVKLALESLLGPQQRLICPQANAIPISSKRNFKIYSWFDIKNTSYEDEDTEGIKKATKYIHHLIDAEVKSGIRSERILIGGFAIGGTLALHAAKTYPQKLGGCIAYSTWFPEGDTFLKHFTYPANRNLQIYKCGLASPRITHHKIAENMKYKSYAEMDHVVTSDSISPANKDIPVFRCEPTPPGSVDRETITNIKYKSYGELDHWIVPKEMEEIKNHFKNILGPVASSN